MTQNVFYVDAKSRIVDFLNNEFDGFPVKLQNRFLNFFPLMTHYLEEGVRYYPSILFTSDIMHVNPGQYTKFAPTATSRNLTVCHTACNLFVA